LVGFSQRIASFIRFSAILSGRRMRIMECSTLKLVGVHCFHVFDGEHLEKIVVVSFEVRDALFVE